MSEEQNNMQLLYGDNVATEGAKQALLIGAERVNSIQKTLQNIQAVKKYLQLNCGEVKSSIHSTISRLLETLRSREVWLLDQVDVVYQAKEAVLRKQEDRLNQVVGSLKNCIDLVKTGSASEDELLAYIESLCSLDQHAEETPHISFRSDMLSLRESIQKFGRVDSKGLSLLGGPFTLRGAQEGHFSGVSGSSSLPQEFEEYGDDEHQILYKTVGADANQDSSSASIVINIPHLSEARRMAAFPTAVDPKTRSHCIAVPSESNSTPALLYHQSVLPQISGELPGFRGGQTDFKELGFGFGTAGNQIGSRGNQTSSIGTQAKPSEKQDFHGFTNGMIENQSFMGAVSGTVGKQKFFGSTSGIIDNNIFSGGVTGTVGKQKFFGSTSGMIDNKNFSGAVSGTVGSHTDFIGNQSWTAGTQTDFRGTAGCSSSVRQWLQDLTNELGQEEEYGSSLSESKLADVVSAIRNAEKKLTTNGPQISGVSNNSNDVRDVSNINYSAGSKIKIMISTPDGQELDQEGSGPVGGVPSLEEEKKVELFESFRRIIQRPLSDWLSRAYEAVIDSQTDQSQEASGFRYTLAAFHQVINSPIKDWLSGPIHSTNKNSAATASIFGSTRTTLCNSNTVEKSTNDVTARSLNTENKWLLGNETPNTEVSKDTKDHGDVLQNLKQQPIGHWLVGDIRAIGHSEFGFSTATSAKPARPSGLSSSLFQPYNPLSSYLQHCATMPNSCWLSSAKNLEEDVALESSQAPDGKHKAFSFGSGQELRLSSHKVFGFGSGKDLNEKENLVNRNDKLVHMNEKVTHENENLIPGKENDYYNIGSKVASCPISQWMCQTENATKVSTEHNIGARIASAPIAEWLNLLPSCATVNDVVQRADQVFGCERTSRKKLNHENSENLGLCDRWLSAESKRVTDSENIARVVPVSSNTFTFCRDKSAVMNMPEFWKNPRLSTSDSDIVVIDNRSFGMLEDSDLDDDYLRVDGSVMHDYGDFDSPLSISFVEKHEPVELEVDPVSATVINQNESGELVSASIKLPAVFSQPMGYWISAQHEKNECDSTEIHQSDVGKSVLDRFALMTVSDWLER